MILHKFLEKMSTRTVSKYDMACAKFFQRKMYYKSYDILESKYGRVYMENQITELLRNEYSKDNANDDEIEVKMFSKIRELIEIKDKEEQKDEEDEEDEDENELIELGDDFPDY